MGDSKGKAWIGKIYNKLENILVEVDTFTAQSTLCLKSRNLEGWESIRSEEDDSSSGTSNMRHDRVASPSSERPFDPPLQQNFEILGNVRVGERVEEDTLNESLLSVSSSPPDGEMLSSRPPLVEDYCRCNLTSATSRGDEQPIITDEETGISNTLTPQGRDHSVFSSEESVEEVRIESGRDLVSSGSQSTQNSLEGSVVESECNGDPVLTAVGISTNDSNLNLIATKIPDGPDNAAYVRPCNEDKTDDVTNGNLTPSNTNALYSLAFREDPSCVDDNALYAVRVRTKKLRSFKRKVLDALNAKRRREEEYEHLAIWFGDADMGSDLATEEDSKQVQESQWELL